MSKITHAMTIFVLLMSIFQYNTSNGRGDSWAQLKTEIFQNWDDILEKYRAELYTKNTFVARGKLPNETQTQTYKIKGDLKMRQFETAEETWILAYNRDYAFEIRKPDNGSWTIERTAIFDDNKKGNVIRFPEFEQDFMHGEVTMLRKSIENAKKPTIQRDPDNQRIRLVFDSSDDVSLEVSEIELDVSVGHYLPIGFSRGIPDGQSISYQREWEVSTSGLPRLVGGISGDIHATSEPPRFDRSLSDKEFYLSYYGLPEPILPNNKNQNWWLVGLILGGIIVAGFGFYLRSYSAKN